MAASRLEQAFVRLVGPSPLWQGLAGGFVIAALNMLGACLVLIWRRPPERFLNASLGFAAGAMLTEPFEPFR
ncbi:MAG: ZIP family metal transporter, partial [Chloroflexota bacterium]